MLPSIDNKKYAQDTRLFKDAIVQDGHFKSFDSSPIIDGVQIKDVCIYAPGDLNKIGKEGRTSWDSFSYAIMMGHNVWMHINSVQEANRQYDAGLCPAMLVQEKFDRIFFKDIIDAIFSTSDRGTADDIVDEFSKFWIDIPGTRGNTGKRTVNADTNFFKLFDTEEPDVVKSDEQEEFNPDDEDKLNHLEEA